MILCNNQDDRWLVKVHGQFCTSFVKKGYTGRMIAILSPIISGNSVSYLWMKKEQKSDQCTPWVK